MPTAHNPPATANQPQWNQAPATAPPNQTPHYNTASNLGSIAAPTLPPVAAPPHQAPNHQRPQWGGTPPTPVNHLRPPAPCATAQHYSQVYALPPPQGHPYGPPLMPAPGRPYGQGHGHPMHTSTYTGYKHPTHPVAMWLLIVTRACDTFDTQENLTYSPTQWD